ncbi:hypothetical protein IX307_001397 [Bacteroides pyogenes]|uniref:hypothetical protein n=1 Tax=Bacteroides pyogenes TaxID=310300 RepID=UPI001BA481A8|nr:hypothetical protein [Bacteroides pyogenes]MBR8720179.1 hypothetical protein [Bacteroides pyogenes]MBR8787076.1 hypothetical protein [Bacteroides pyogenes]MBR8792556.1 hypothetical protein [Bacteroides pyogenes]
MKYLILKQEIITGDSKLVIRENVETSDVEGFRKEIKNAMRCDRVLLAYCEV